MREQEKEVRPANDGPAGYVPEVVAPPLPEPSADDIPRRRAKRGSRATERKLLVLLSRLVSAASLAKELRVSYQRVGQLLKALLEQGNVVRVPEPGASRRWLWLRSDVSAEDCLRHYVPPVPNGQAKVLNALEPEAFHWPGDVVPATGQSTSAVTKQVQQLEAKGLLVNVRLGRKRYIGLTPRGLEHPWRMPSAARSVVADLSKGFGDKLIAFLEILAVLSEARTVDVTAALAGGERPGTGLLSGQMIASMMKSGLAEPVAGKSGTRMSYRLTARGKLAAALIALNRTPPTREHIEQRTASYRKRPRQRAMRAGGKYGTAAGSPGQQAILDALDAGPLSSMALGPVVSGYVRHPRSVDLMVRSLERRGLVQRVGRYGRAIVWSLPPQGGVVAPESGDG